MATKLNLDPSLRFTEPSLRSFHQQRAAACLALQEDLDAGFFALTEAVTKMESFKERVRSMGKKHQEEKRIAPSGNAQQRLHAQLEEEYRGYKATELKTVILFQNIESTISFIQPARRSRSDEKSLQENLPDYYKELTQCEAMFSQCINQIKSIKSILSPLKHTLSAAMSSKILATALEKLCSHVKNQKANPSRSERFLSHIAPSIVVEKAPKSKSESPLYAPSWKTLPIEFMNQSTEELLSTSSRRQSTDSGECVRFSSQTRQLLSYESLSSSSPRKGFLSAEPSSHSSRRTVPSHLSGSGGNRPSNFSQERFTHLSSSSSPRNLPTYGSPRTLEVPHLTRKKYEQDVDPEPKHSRRLHLPHHPLLSRKTYEHADASSYSRSHY